MKQKSRDGVKGMTMKYFSMRLFKIWVTIMDGRGVELTA